MNCEKLNPEAAGWRRARASRCAEMSCSLWWVVGGDGDGDGEGDGDGGRAEGANAGSPTAASRQVEQISSPATRPRPPLTHRSGQSGSRPARRTEERRAEEDQTTRITSKTVGSSTRTAKTRASTS